MLFINDTDSRVRVMIEGEHWVEPKDMIDIPEGYSWPRRSTGGLRIPSTVECVAPQLKPADPELRVKWEATPEPAQRHVAKPAMPTVESLVRNGVPKGVAIEMIKKMHQSAIDSLDQQKPAETAAKRK